jgi:hypothetical protein
VSVEGRVIAFVGSSGAGKSTLAAAACRGGARLVADDVLRVEVGDPVLAHPGASHSRLREGVAALAAGVTDGRSADGRVVARFDRVTVPLPLVAVVVPTADGAGLTRLGGADALIELCRFPRVAGWRDPQHLQTHFDHLARLAQRVPVYRAGVSAETLTDPGAVITMVRTAAS